MPSFTDYDSVFTNVLARSCADASCHSAGRRAGDLSLADKDSAYDQLIQKGLVKPGDPGCSELIVRTNSPGEDYQMPPGDALDAPAQCGLIHWVNNGAMR